jgi:hypothetical protein
LEVQKLLLKKPADEALPESDPLTGAMECGCEVKVELLEAAGPESWAPIVMF